jgi:hypothetical protein
MHKSYSYNEIYNIKNNIYKDLQDPRQRVLLTLTGRKFVATINDTYIDTNDNEYMVLTNKEVNYYIKNCIKKNLRTFDSTFLQKYCTMKISDIKKEELLKSIDLDALVADIIREKGRKIFFTDKQENIITLYDVKYFIYQIN